MSSHEFKGIQFTELVEITADLKQHWPLLLVENIFLTSFFNIACSELED